MHDLKFIRDNPDQFDAAMAQRKLPPQAEIILSFDKKRRGLQTQLQDLQMARNGKSKEIGKAKKTGDDAKANQMMSDVTAIKIKMSELEKQEITCADELSEILAGLPNMPFVDVSIGDDEDDNIEQYKWGEIPSFDFEPKQHFDLGEDLGLMDFDTASKISGARFVILKGALSKLERGLANFMIDVQTGEHGCLEITPPALVRQHALYGTGQLPKFKEDLFHTDDGFWLIPTAEVPLTNMVRDTILDAKQLPMRFCALTQCFRAEAGSAGRDTRGMIRQHQFSKVEMVSITSPENSDEELERMTQCAAVILQKLGLAYRVVSLCTGDLGFSARRTNDLEVWLPGQDKYREISSCSNCGDFQARRMKGRFRDADAKGTKFFHTLNGSGLAVGRCLVAILENYQNQDGSITIPDILIPYMGGLSVIERAK